MQDREGIKANMLKLVASLFLSRSGIFSVRVRVSLFVSCFNDRVLRFAA